jgi:hypothetical protein
MCHYYAHVYTCKHTTYALGKYCTPSSLVQNPCKKKSIWQTIRMAEECEECAAPPPRTNTGNGGNGEERKAFVRAVGSKGKKRVLKR